MPSPTHATAASPVSRWKAFGTHLGVSASIATAVVALMYFVWYPHPLFEAMGADGLVIILVGVDVVLGPLVTLIVANPGKPWRVLRRDIAVIAVLQAAALAYGVHIVAIARPVYVVFSWDRFDAVAANQIFDEDLPKARRPEFRTLPWGSPRVIAVQMPSDPAEQLRVIQWAASGSDLQTFVEYYLPYEELARAALEKSKPIADLRKRNPDGGAVIDAALARAGRRDDEVRFLPLKARMRDMAVILDAKTGAVLGYAEVNPW